jgi:acyl carrier protein phosphodiesterase
MNILAHLHLATLAHSSLIGNTVADFVKGDPYLIYDTDIADGIMLHRKIDSLTDNLLEVKQAKLLFRQSYQRVAAITLDIVWDHFLSKHWDSYGLLPSVAQFNEATKVHIQPYISAYPVDYQHFMNAMWRGLWLENYASLDFVGDVLAGMAQRRPKLYLLEETIIDIKQHYGQLEALFFLLYPKICLTVKQGIN